uniref:Polysaccharide biosynthesis protein n=1 Tax=Fervidobacterium nodosum TaxID=2424 RepID=A0A7C5U8T0_9BACT
MLNKRNFWLFLIDNLLLILAGLNALFVRFGFDFKEMSKFSKGVYVLIAITVISNVLNGTYKIVWRYATPKEIIILLRGLFFGYAFTLIFLHFTHLVPLPRSVGMLTFLGSYFLLLSARVFYQFFVNWKRKSGKRIGIIGAGDAGVILLNEIKRTEYGDVVAFFDDDPKKIGRYIAGVKVLDSIENVNNHLEPSEIQELIISIPSASKELMNKIISNIDTSKVSIKTFPSISQLLDREPTIRDLREISIQDIIGREPVNVDISSISQYLSGKVVLVTGAGGSIGSEIARQVCRFSPRKLILLGRGENTIYETYNELKENYIELDIQPVVADVSDEKLMEKIFQDLRPEIVFHAAAHKHVFFMQANLYEALRVNVLGTINLAKLACKHKVERFVFISTDKAVNPTSYMGMSKRIAELYLLSIPDNCQTLFSIVRFGNVIGSRGSVLWKFKKQIERGEPVTITDPRMKRYWMSIPEAVSLVIQAGAFSKGKELFVLDMGEQIPVEQVAKSLAKVMGKPNIQIKYTGALPGEKLEEELFYSFEKPESTMHPKINRVTYDNVRLSSELIEKTVREIMETYLLGNEKKTKELIEQLIRMYE